MPQIFYKDGKPVPEEKISEAIATGEAHAKGRVSVRDENGTVGTIDASELGKGGYQPLTDAEINEARIHEERGTLGQQAITAAEGAARGATLGLSDVAATGLLGDEYRQGAQERAGENKKIALGSEIAGAIAPALLSGGGSAGAQGAGLAARAARLAPSALVSSGGRAIERGVARIIGEAAPSMLGRMAQRAAAVGASGAVEGGLYGAGNALSQAALNDTPITAEKVLGGFGHGALFGGGVGAGLGAAGGLASSAFERIVGGSAGLKASAEKLANESALKAVGFQGTDFRKLIGRRAGEAAENKIADAGSELLNYKFDSGPLKGQKLFTGAKKAEDFVDDLALAKEEVGAKIGAVKRQVDAAGAAPDAEAYLARVRAEVLDPLKASNSPTIRNQAKRVEEELAALSERANTSLDVNVGAFDRGSMRPDSFEWLRKNPGKGDAAGIPRIEIYPDAMTVANGRHRLALAHEAGERSALADVVRYDAEGNILSRAKQNVSLSSLDGAPAVTPARPITFGELERQRADLRNVFQPPSPPGGGMPPPVPEHALHLQKAERILAEELDKTVEKHLASAGLDATEYARNKKTFSALADIEKVANKAAAQQLGNRALSPSDYGTGIATAMGAMISGNVGGALMGGAGAVAHKIIRERGRSVLAVMADSVAKMDGRIADAAQSLAGLAAAPRRAALVAATAPTISFDRTAEAVRSFASNPQSAAQALARPIEGIAPEHPQLAAQMQQTLAGDYQYLATKLPKSLGRADSSLTPQLEKSRVPKSEQQRFMAIVQAIENPASVIEKIAAGELPRDQIEALKARRPEIYNQMRTEAIKAFSIAKAPRGILERTRVSLAFDFNGDASLDPQTLAAIQAGNRTAAPPEDQPQLSTGQQPQQQQGAKMNPKSAETLATPSQKAIGS